LTSEARLALGDPREREEAVLEVTRQQGTVLQVFDRLSLGVQYPLDSLDDVVATRQEEFEKFEMGLKWHLAKTQPGRPFFRCKERMRGHALKQFSCL
jgi:hypothetical protein